MTFEVNPGNNSPAHRDKAATTKLQQSVAQRGASLVEYALLIGLVATIGIIAMRSLGQTMSSQFSYTAGVLKGE